jgi:hypothetical protein
MMTNFILNQQDTKYLKYCIGDLFVQMTIDYQQAQAERKELTGAFFPGDEAFSILEELELITVDLRGYASQLQVRGWIEDRSTAITHLQTLRVFSIPTISQWYFETDQNYPKLKDYVRKLDYVRLLLLEYLQADIHG